MEALKTLTEALKFYGIEILSVNSNHVKVQDKYEIEVEANGLYKLLDDGYIVAPFNDINELCRFILNKY
jgi:hypothetical protein